MTLIKVERELSRTLKPSYFATIELDNKTVIKIPIHISQFNTVFQVLYQNLQEQLNDGFGARREMK